MQTTEAKTLYVGADLHGNNFFLSVIDGGGKEPLRGMCSDPPAGSG